jgi:hypothetical protein
MKRHLMASVVCTVVLSACTTTKVLLETPIDVVATVSKPHYTGWQIDHCKGEESSDPDTACISHGGEIYKARLSGVRTLDGKRIVPTLTIGIPAHSLARDFRARIRLHLVKSADDLRKDTGIEYIASHWQWPQ